MSTDKYEYIGKDFMLFKIDTNICNYTTDKFINNTIKCSDTGKNGLYFVNNILVAVAMCIKYNKLFEIGLYFVKLQIDLSKGKLPYDDIDHLSNKNISHVEYSINDFNLEYDSINKKLNSVENKKIFLSKNDLTRIEFSVSFKFNEHIKSPNDLLKYVLDYDRKWNKIPFGYMPYFSDDIIIEFDCAKKIKKIIEKLKENIRKLLYINDINDINDIKEEINEAFNQF
jgi:hypothetical protein